MNGKVITTSKTNFKQRKQLVNYAALRVFVGKTSMKNFYYFIHSFFHSFFHSFLFQSLTVKIQVLM